MNVRGNWSFFKPDINNSLLKCRLKDNFMILHPLHPIFPLPMSKRQLETKFRALRYINVRPLKQLFLSLTGSDCTNKSQYTEHILF